MTLQEQNQLYHNRETPKPNIPTFQNYHPLVSIIDASESKV